MAGKMGPRLAYYEVTGMSDPSPVESLKVGDTLVDRPRGEFATWEFLNTGTGVRYSWITGKRLGFGRQDLTTKLMVPEPKMQAVIGARIAEEK